MRFALPLAAIALAFLAFTAPALADGYPLTVESVTDGDTIHAVVRIGLGVSLDSQPIRLADFDAWEISRVRFGNLTRDEELIRGAKAKADLQALLKSAVSVYGIQVNKSGRDVYGRVLLKVKIVDADGKVQDVAELMRGMGHERGEP